MKHWIFTIVLALLCAGQAHATSVVFPSKFNGMSVTKEMVQIIPGKDGAVLVTLKISVPPGSNPMQGFREDMWISKQLWLDKHRWISPVLQKDTRLTEQGGQGLTPAQKYAVLFCDVNAEEHGFTCEHPKEIFTASTEKPWLIPIVVLPEKMVGDFTTFLMRGPIQVPEARMAGVTNGQTVTGVPGRIVVDKSLIPQMAPRRLEVYSGPVPEHLRRDLQVLPEAKPEASPAKKVTGTASGPARAKKAGSGGPSTKDRTP